MTVRKSISFTDAHDNWLKDQVASGQYASESEVIRDLIREKQTAYHHETPEEIEAIRKILEMAEKSGTSDRTPEQIWKETKLKLKTNAKL